MNPVTNAQKVVKNRQIQGLRDSKGDAHRQSTPMAWITLLNAQLAFGHVALLDHTDFALQSAERVGLIGRNGTGKSSLLKILAGMDKPDDGVLQMQTGVQVAYVSQEPVLDPESTVFDAVKHGLASTVALIEQYSDGEGDIDALHAAIDAADGWTWEQRVTETLQRLSLDGDAKVGSLSGGLKKRVALAQALAQRPDVLLLDEPTNHLDMAAIGWLEDLLVNFKGSVLVITHDRAFLDRVATRIVELDRGQLRSYPGNFAAYELLKAQELADEAVSNAKFDKLLAQEEIWIRKGVEARRTRATARIERLQGLRGEAAERRKRMGEVNFAIDTGQKSGKLVCELQDVSKHFVRTDPDTGETTRKDVVSHFSATIMRGDKIGLVGANGAGKTTLLKMILGELEPDADPIGMVRDTPAVRLGTQIQVAYFDQLREALDPEASIEDFISPGSEWIEINNERKHVRSYLSDFLFSPERARSPVKSLSGGERNRLLLARLFARPANVLVLDEPTNDLDIDTLALLEELLAQYNGTVFLVSHDRRFLDNVVTSVIVNEPSPGNPGVWREYVGGIQDWLVQSARRTAAIKAGQSASGADPRSAAHNTVATNRMNTATIGKNQSINDYSAAATAQAKPAAKKPKLSFKDQRELDGLPAAIAALELEQNQARAKLADGKLYSSDPEQAAALARRDAEIDDELLAKMERMEVLG